MRVTEHESPNMCHAESLRFSAIADRAFASQLMANRCRRATRPSVVADYTCDPPMAPVTPAELRAMPPLLAGAIVAAWAYAEGCPLQLVAGRLELWCRHTPSAALEAALEQESASILAAIGVGVPVMRTRESGTTWASWPPSFLHGVS